MPLATLATLALFAVTPEQLEDLHVSFEGTSTEVRLGDVVFVRISVTNNGKKPVQLPPFFSRTTGNLDISVIDQERDTSFALRADCGGFAGYSATKELKPGERWLVAYDILKIPPLVSIEWPFWNPKTLSKEPYLLSATLEVNRFVSFGNWGPSLTIRPRPDAEMDKLLKLCRPRRGAWTRTAVSRDIYRPGMNWFGFTWAPPECSTPKNLAILDELLTPGSLRDIVHLTRLAQAVYDENSEEQRDHKLDGLLEWLDTLPEIERKCLAAEISAWANGNKGARALRLSRGRLGRSEISGGRPPGPGIP